MGLRVSFGGLGRVAWKGMGATDADVEEFHIGRLRSISLSRDAVNVSGRVSLIRVVVAWGSCRSCDACCWS